VAVTAPLYSPAAPACTSTVTWAVAWAPAARVRRGGVTVTIPAGAGLSSAVASSVVRFTVVTLSPRFCSSSGLVTGWTPVCG